MKRRVVLINVLIFAGVVIFAARFRSTWDSFEQGNSLEGIVVSAQQDGGSAGPSTVESMGRPGPFSEFVVVSQKTLFAESRRPESQEEVEVEDPVVVVEEPPKWAARPMLHGVSAVGGRRLGVMTVFEGNQKTGELRNAEVGDLVQGDWVDEIGETTISLRWGDRDEIIDMADATKPAAAGRRGAAGKVTVINVGSAPSAVETTSAATEPEGSSLEVSVVSAPSGQGGGRQAGAAVRQGAAQPARQGTEQDEGVQRFIEGR